MFSTMTSLLLSLPVSVVAACVDNNESLLDGSSSGATDTTLGAAATFGISVNITEGLMIVESETEEEEGSVIGTSGEDSMVKDSFSLFPLGRCVVPYKQMPAQKK